METVESVMTRDPVCCTADEGVIECAQMMERENVGIIPVVESIETRKLIGVVTDRDVCLSVVATGRHPEDLRVEDCMTDELFTVRPSDDFQHALDLMKQHQIRRLPVIDDTGCCVGILSQADVSRTASAKDVKATVGEISRDQAERNPPRGV